MLKVSPHLSCYVKDLIRCTNCGKKNFIHISVIIGLHRRAETKRGVEHYYLFFLLFFFLLHHIHPKLNQTSQPTNILFITLVL